MTIKKNLRHKLLIAAFIMTTMTGSHQLNAMEPVSINNINEVSLEADFQAYLFLSTINNDDQCYLLPELVQIIATNVSKLIDKECYDEYGDCLCNPKSLLRFIENRCSKSIMNHIHIANILKRCLTHSDKSLGEIKDEAGRKVFHVIVYNHTDNPLRSSILARVEWVKVLHLVAGNEVWNLMCMKNDYNSTPLHSVRSLELTTELLSIAPSSQEAWNLIITPDKYSNTALSFTIYNGYTKITELLESYRPKEQ